MFRSRICVVGEEGYVNGIQSVMKRQAKIESGRQQKGNIITFYDKKKLEQTEQRKIIL